MIRKANAHNNNDYYVYKSINNDWDFKIKTERIQINNNNRTINN